MTPARVTGPISGGAHGWPYGAATRDLEREGYLEEEYFLTGEATRYRPLGELAPDGRWSVGPAGSSPFTTRLLVRRPRDPARFNGTVILEWNNVSAGFEIFEAGDTSVIFDEGFAYVGVSAQRVGVHGHHRSPLGLRAWDPERYGELDIADDAISYGIFTAAARAVSGLRSADSVDPLGGLAVQRLIATGASQSAGRLVTYINAVQPLERVFDAFLPAVWFGSGMSVDDPTVVDLGDPEGLAALQTYPTQIRSDLEVPVMVVNSECEAVPTYPVRQPDTDRFRYWEVAGAAHGPRRDMERIFAKLMRDKLQLPTPAGAPPIDPATLVPVPWVPVQDAAVAHVQRWMTGGEPPPTQPRIDVAGDPPRIRRDDDGNAVGGVRVPEMDVTLTRNIGDLSEAGAGGLMGLATPLPADVLRRRYPDLDTYVAAFRAAADKAVQAGVLRPRDADEAVAAAKSATLP
jgi:hypothetical protein